jgi:hypothetical protein
MDGIADTAPLPDTVYDHGSGTTNGLLTEGGMIDIKGYNLKFLPEQEDNGVFLLQADGQYYLKLLPVATNTPHHIIVQLPPSRSCPNACRLEVRTSYNSSGVPLKTLKVGRLQTVLTVATPPNADAAATKTDI